jgi:hypothetical protein
MDWQKTLYPGLWCILLVITGLLIWIIRLVSGYSDQVLIYAYYGCAVAALIALCFLVINVARVITEEQPGRDIRKIP